jgi:hypothetical protein
MVMSRRFFVSAASAAGLLWSPTSGASQGAAAPPVSDTYPAHEPATVQEMVAAAHGNVGRVRELLASRPALADAGWDWGFGDWEAPIGAAAHVGNIEIATMLLASGARPTIFSAAMLGQLEVVRAFVTASPGIQRVRGAHGITLLSHATAGKAGAVVDYLRSIEGANIPYRNEPLSAGDPDALVGEYRFGLAANQRLVVSVLKNGALAIRREGAFDRNLFHLGGRVFHPAGAEAVRIRFAAGMPAPQVTIEDGGSRLAATRI